MTTAPGNPFDQLARFYDWEHRDFRDDLPFYLGLADRIGGPILEAACGTGRLAVPLAEAGYEVVGIDSSPEMLARVEARLATDDALRQRLRVLPADLRSLRLGRKFGLAIVALDSFGLLVSQQEQHQALASLRRHLAHRGLLAIDLANGNLRGGEPAEETVLHLRGALAASGSELIKWVRRQTDHAEQVDRLLQVYDETGPDGLVRRTTVELTLRYFTRFELELLLEGAGFIVEALFGDYDLSPFAAGSQRLIAVAHAGQPERRGPRQPRQVAR